MATTDTGINDELATRLLNEIVVNGVDVRLLTTEPAYSDSRADLSTYEVDTTTNYSPVSLAANDFSVTTGSTFADGGTLTNDVTVDFGAADTNWGTIEAIVLDTGQDFLVDTTISQEIVAGIDAVQIDANAITYEVGA